MTFLAALVVLMCLPWLVLPFLGLLVVRKVPRLSDQTPEPALDEDGAPVRVAVVVPACDEEEAIEEAVRTQLAAADEALEVIVVNDRSRDGTGAIVDRLAAEDARVRPLHITELPDGWLGKNHALHRALQQTDADWVLFTDADVHVEPGVVRRAVDWCTETGVDHLALLPWLWPSGFLVDAVMESFGRAFMVGQRIWAVADPGSDAFVGVGAFNLVRRDVFLATGGFEPIKLEVADDLAVGHAMKTSGARCAALSGIGSIGLAWYRTVGQMAHGLEKNTFVLAGCSVPRVVVAGTAVASVHLAPLVAVLPVWSTWVHVFGWAAWAAIVLSSIAGGAWNRRRVLPGIAAPIGGVLMAWIMVRAALIGKRRGGVSWRGTFYPLDVVREGTRLRVP